MFIGATKKEKLYGAFKFKSASDRRIDNWSKTNSAPTLFGISKIANNWLDEKTTYAVDIRSYNFEKKKWEPVVTKFA